MSKNCNHATCQGEYCRREKKKRNPYKLRPFSKKRVKENKKYSALRKQFLEDHTVCEAKLEGCTGVATECHHKIGRGIKLLDEENLLAVCHSCHQKITVNSKQAIQKGLSKRRLTLRRISHII